jgi:prevent-host-death family protein
MTTPYAHEYWAEPFSAEVDQLDLVNMEQVNVQDAKTRFSELLNLVERGEDVVIAKAGRPVARLVKIEQPTQRRLGFLKGKVPDNILEPMTEEELAEWERPLI